MSDDEAIYYEKTILELNAELKQLRAQNKELESFIEGLANDHYARLSVLEWLRERKHDTTTS